MNTQTKPDISSIFGIKGNIHELFSLIEKSLDHYKQDTDNTHGIESSRTYIRQLDSLFQVLELDSITVVTDKIEQLITALITRKADNIPASVDAIKCAINAMIYYLDKLIDGVEENPLRLFSVYQNLMHCLGNHQISKFDLFYPTLTKEPPLKPALYENNFGKIKTLTKRARSEYQAGLVLLLKNASETNHLEKMHRALNQVEQLPGSLEQRTFWWVSTGFIEALISQASDIDLSDRKLCGKIEQALRHFTAGLRKNSQLIRELLYRIATLLPALDPNERIEAIQTAYALSPLTESDTFDFADLTAQQACLSEMKKLSKQANENWQAVCTNNADLATFLSNIVQLHEQAIHLQCAPIQQLIESINHAANALHAQQTHATTVHEQMEIAAALLNLENFIDNFNTQSDNLSEQVESTVTRLTAGFIPNKTPADSQSTPTPATPKEISNPAQKKQLHIQTVQEVLTNLQQIEKNLEQFFKTPDEHTSLSTLTHLFDQTSGVLNILELNRADHLLTLCHSLEKKFLDPNYCLIESDKNLLVDGLSSLSFFLEAFKYDQTASPRVLESAITIFENTAYQNTSDHATAPANESDLEDIEEIDITETEIVPNFYAEPVNKVDSGIEPELLSIFLEEADEILTEIATCLQSCNTIESLTTIRRGFHTLKGSSRMVKLESFSEAAWIMEKTLNHWLNEKKQITDGLINLIQSAYQAFTEWCSSLQATGEAEIQFDRLRSLINDLETDEVTHQSDAEQTSSNSQSDTGNTPPLAISIGGITIPTDLFEIFTTESKQHLATLEQELETLHNTHPAVVNQPLTLATHTLASTSRAIKLDFIADLSGKLEAWLTQLKETDTQLGNSDINLIQNCTEQIGELLCKVHQQQFPDETDLKLSKLLSQEILKRQQKDEVSTYTTSEPANAGEHKIKETPESVHSEVSSEQPLEEISDNETASSDLLQTFFEETHEIIPQLNAQLRAWRILPQDEDVRLNLLRLLHTLKGSANMVGAQQLGELVHSTEEEIQQAFNNVVVSMRSIEAVEYQFDQICEAIEQLQQHPTAVEEPSVTEVEAPDTSDTPSDTTEFSAPPVTSIPEDPEPSATKLEDTHQPINVLRVHAELIDRLVNESGEASILRNKIETQLNQSKQSLQDLTESIDRLHEQLREIEIQAETQITARTTQQANHGNFLDPLEFDRFTRLQELTRLMAESIDDVITVQKNLNTINNTATEAVGQQAIINHRLQQELMRIRTVPFESISERYYRVIRKTANDLCKKVDLQIQGKAIEIDRSVLEKLSASFEHILRNAVVHGIEKPDYRAQLGKPETGQIGINIHQSSSEVTITIRDDGSGLNLENIREEAIKKRLINADEALDNEQISALIFAPGLTTLDYATDSAGRGMGMDIVQNDISGLGGHITVRSAKDKGTIFYIQLPIMLAVTRALLVSSGNQVLAIPTTIVAHAQELDPDVLNTAYQEQQITHNNKTYPFTYLPFYLGNLDTVPETKRRNQILLLQSGDLKLAVHVDELIGNHEVIVKKVGPQIMHAPGVESATVTGDGKPALILNPLKLLQREDVQQILKTPVADIISRSTRDDQHIATVLVVDDALTVRKVVSRLLEQKGYNVLTAKQGIEAMETIKAIKPEIILTDLEMPKMNGFELIKTIRSNPDTTHIPIIVITSRTAEKHHKMATQLGANGFMGKPYNEDELLNTISQCLPKES